MRRMKFLSGIFLVAFLFCTPRVGKINTTVEQVKSPTVEAAPPVYQSSDAQVTLLDTLNAGNEINLSDLAVGNTSIVQTPTGNSAAVHYRIQVLASNQIDNVRNQKKNLTTQTKLSLLISFESPYYKLFAGDFVKRTDAETELAKFKKLGFTDAWIVSSNDISK